jgi:hypothetical protein
MCFATFTSSTMCSGGKCALQHLPVLLCVREATVCFATFTSSIICSGGKYVLCNIYPRLPDLLCFLHPLILRVARRSKV